jgi:predicted Zn-dependent peptidase
MRLENVRSKRARRGVTAIAVAATTLCAWRVADSGEILIPYEKFRLDNGLTVIVHTDRKAPIVAVNLWYHVGSKNERAGKTGFAHLFEHLMFQGSENHNDEFFKPMEEVGATAINGTTNFDRTNYFQNVPTTALPLALWMESDRMGHLLGVIDQARLDEQRGVVKNEKRQGENQPYGRVFEALVRASFPVGHPYHWLPIGSMEDLDAASLEDVKEWFRTYYGAANAVLVLAGDIDVATAQAEAQKYFGHIAPGPAITRPEIWVAARTESTRETMYDQVAQTRLHRFWNTPQDGTTEADLLVLAGEILGGGKTSRLYERLVYRDQIADSASAGQSALEIAGLFGIQADVKAGVDGHRVEAAIEDELQRFMQKGPTREEMDRARMAVRASFIKGLERIGGFGGKADVLASCAVYEGDPGCYQRSLRVVAEATPEQVRQVAARWLAQGDHTLEVRPYPAHQAAAGDTVDRSKGPPATETFPDLAFPALERATLANGIPVVIASRPSVPVVRVSALFDAGFAADREPRLGLSSYAMAMLDEGAGGLDALAIADRAKTLGADLGSGSALDTSAVSVSALAEQLDPSLQLLATLVREPDFPQHEIDRVKREWIAAIQREKTSPDGLARRLLPPLLYGAEHPYAIPFSGSGTEAAIAAITREDLLGFQRDWLRPDNVTLIVVGDTTREAILPLLEKHLGGWSPPPSARPAKSMPSAARPAAARLYLIDKPEAVQSSILVGLVAPSSAAPNAIEMDTMNDVLGGTFTSRLNMNLREDKHWSYGVRSYLPDAQGERPWLLAAPVQTDRTVDAMRELRREIEEFVGTRPTTTAELRKVTNRQVRALSGRYETNAAVASAIAEMIVFDRPDDYVRTLKARIEAQTDAAVQAAAREALDPARLTWIVVGDLGVIERPIRELGFGEVRVLDADGRTVR